MKNVLVLLLTVFVCLTAKSQQIDMGVYAGASAFRNKSFDDNFFGDVEVGVSFLNKFWLSPEVSAGYTFGDLNDFDSYDTQDPNFVNERVETSYKGTFYSLGGRLRVTKREDVWLILTPKYVLGNYKFNSNYYERQNENNYLTLTETASNRSSFSYFNFGAGIEGYLDSEEKLLASFSILYTTRYLKDEFDKLSFENTNRSTGSASGVTIGVGVKFQYCLF